MNPGEAFVEMDPSRQETLEVNSSRLSLPYEVVAAPWSNGAYRPFYHRAKRGIDLAGAALLIILLLPLMFVIAMLIKLETPGPIFFVQERIGSRRSYRDGKCVWAIRRFPFYKFRSMFRDTDESVHVAYIRAFAHNRIQKSSDRQVDFKLAGDRRITRVGRLLRRTSLDELPQLLNVLKGDMSLVGPRPVPAYEVAEYQPEHWGRLAAVPGITGLWQINGRGRVTFEEMIRMDLEYIGKQSCWFDCKILLATIPAVLSGHGAK
jgi:lipopolysaccharide/colanic/teichoic acid biosynthesis glycosyltransferase